MLWHSSQGRVVTKWFAGLPVALVPLWQLAHDPVTAEWSNVAGTQARVEWQSPHWAFVAMCAEGFPVATVPL
jgi:hypothetical protein